jgi:hypothetical protein
MRFFDWFKRSNRSEPIDLSEANKQIMALSAKIDGIKANSMAPDTEAVADELLALCEDLLRRAVPPDMALLRKCGTDVDAILSALDKARESKVLIGIDTSLDIRFQLQIERLILSKLREGIRTEYMRGCLAKLVVIMARHGSNVLQKRAEARSFLEGASRLFAELRDDKGASFIKDKLSSLALDHDGHEVQETDPGEQNTVMLQCPCCGENRLCKRFSADTGPLVMISTRGRIPYNGILLCSQGMHLCCGAKAKWVVFTGLQDRLRRMKDTGQVPTNAEFLAPKCGHPGCNGDLYVLPSKIIDQAAEAGPNVLKIVAEALRNQSHGR